MAAALIATILTGLLVWYSMTKRNVSTSEVTVAALTGLAMGLLLDWVLGYALGLWVYTRHPYWTPSYWIVLPAMWTEFGIGTYVTWKIARPRWAVVPVTFLVYELYGVARDSWHYATPWWLVFAGWIVMMTLLVVCVNCALLLLEYGTAGAKTRLHWEILTWGM